MEGKLQGTKTMGTLLRRMKVIVFFHVWDKMDLDNFVFQPVCPRCVNIKM